MERLSALDGPFAGRWTFLVDKTLPYYRGSRGAHPPAQSPCIWDMVSTHAPPPKDASCPYPTNSTSNSSRRWQKAPTVELRTSDGYEVRYSPSLIATAKTLVQPTVSTSIPDGSENGYMP